MKTRAVSRTNILLLLALIGLVVALVASTLDTVPEKLDGSSAPAAAVESDSLAQTVPCGPYGDVKQCKDTDCDGIPEKKYKDDDGDGVKDGKDKDYDDDGIPDKCENKKKQKKKTCIETNS